MIVIEMLSYLLPLDQNFCTIHSHPYPGVIVLEPFMSGSVESLLPRRSWKFDSSANWYWLVKYFWKKFRLSAHRKNDAQKHSNKPWAINWSYTKIRFCVSVKFNYVCHYVAITSSWSHWASWSDVWWEVCRPQQKQNGEANQPHCVMVRSIRIVRSN